MAAKLLIGVGSAIAAVAVTTAGVLQTPALLSFLGADAAAEGAARAADTGRARAAAAHREQLRALASYGGESGEEETPASAAVGGLGPGTRRFTTGDAVPRAAVTRESAMAALGRPVYPDRGAR